MPRSDRLARSDELLDETAVHGGDDLDAGALQQHLGEAFAGADVLARIDPPQAEPGGLVAEVGQSNRHSRQGDQATISSAW